MYRTVALFTILSVIGQAAATRACAQEKVDLHLDRGLPELVLGETDMDLLARFPSGASRGAIPTEGDAIPTLTLQIERRWIIAHLADSRVEGFETHDSSLRTTNGAGVGSTLTQLRTRYPKGEFSYGAVEGGYVVYLVKTETCTLAFQFDPARFAIEQIEEGTLSLEDSFVLDSTVTSVWVTPR